MEGIDKMSVSELKRVIQDGGLSFEGLVEKSELQERAREAASNPINKKTSEDKKTENYLQTAQKMSVKELKEIILKASMSYSGLTEKPELQDRAAAALEFLANRKISFFEKPFGSTLLTKSGIKNTSDVLGDKYVLIYFSAHWCPPCRQFTPILADWYEKHKDDKNFEVVFVSMDRDESSFDDYYSSMPWTSVPYNSNREGISGQYGAQGIPELVVLTPEGTITRRGAVRNVQADPQAKWFPWKG